MANCVWNLFNSSIFRKHKFFRWQNYENAQHSRLARFAAKYPPDRCRGRDWGNLTYQIMLSTKGNGCSQSIRSLWLNCQSDGFRLLSHRSIVHCPVITFRIIVAQFVTYHHSILQYHWGSLLFTPTCRIKTKIQPHINLKKTEAKSDILKFLAFIVCVAITLHDQSAKKN